MAIISCPKCAKEISDNAQSCPHCGTPIATVPAKDDAVSTPKDKNNKDKSVSKDKKKNKVDSKDQKESSKLEHLWAKERLLVIVALLWAILIILVIFKMIGFSSHDTKAIKVVKTGSLELCRDHTIEEMVNSFLSKPSWKEIKGTDRKTYVNISGGISYQGKPAKAILQFQVDSNTFQTNALEINGVGQDLITTSVLLRKMCESADE